MRRAGGVGTNTGSVVKCGRKWSSFHCFSVFSLKEATRPSSLGVGSAVGLLRRSQEMISREVSKGVGAAGSPQGRQAGGYKRRKL